MMAKLNNKIVIITIVRIRKIKLKKLSMALINQIFKEREIT